ncbi:hypothetical protein E2F47_22185 [Mycobacterium eburneum]|nr:hypothetical protein [Mycobacterium eburneum]TDH48877.1 hypothetical protein E2F47_22185 [Mycobacterium eburneum]
MPGPAKKPAAKRQNRVTNDVGAVGAPGMAPMMPRGLCRQAQSAWTAYWRDALSGTMRKSDATLVLRWVKNLDRYHRLLGAADKSPVVEGSTGQPRTNPIYDLALKVEASIKDDEKQLGIGPLNRLRLGMVLTESAKSLADLNAEAEEEDAEGDDDPRATFTVINA